MKNERINNKFNRTSPGEDTEGPYADLLKDNLKHDKYFG